MVDKKNQLKCIICLIIKYIFAPTLMHIMLFERPYIIPASRLQKPRWQEPTIKPYPSGEEIIRPNGPDSRTYHGENEQRPTKHSFSPLYLMSQNLEIITDRQNDTNDNTHSTPQERHYPIKLGEHNCYPHWESNREDTHQGSVDTPSQGRCGRCCRWQ